MASSSLVSSRAVTPTVANRSAALCRLAGLATLLSTRWTSSAWASLEQRLQFLDLDFVARAAAGGVQQDQVHSRQPVDGGPHLARRGHDLHRQVDDVGIGPQLIHGRDPVGVHGDQPDAPPFAEAEVGRQLGDRRRLADAGRPDQGHDPRLRRLGLGSDRTSAGRLRSAGPRGPSGRRGSARSRGAAPCRTRSTSSRASSSPISASISSVNRRNRPVGQVRPGGGSWRRDELLDQRRPVVRLYRLQLARGTWLR